MTDTSPDSRATAPEASLAASPAAAPSAKPDRTLSHQERVYFEMFRAIEQLGRKLEKSEAERYLLSRRLADIEASAQRDEATGRYYLPAKIEPAVEPAAGAALPPRLRLGVAGSCAFAFLALVLVLMQDRPQGLSPRQLAAVEALVAQDNTLARKSAPWHGRIMGAAPEEAPADENTLSAEDQSARAPAPDGDVQADADLVLSGAETHVLPAAPAPEELPVHGAALPMPVPAAAVPAPAVAKPIVVKPAAALADDAAWAVDAADAPASVEAPAPEEGFAAAGDTEEGGEDVSAAASEALPPVSAALLPPAPASAAKAAVAAAETTKPQAPRLSADERLPQSLKPLEMRAFDGVPEAQHDLAAIYAEGRRVRLDYARARAWFTRAAAAGVANAYYNLGVMEQQGLGQPVDLKAAMAHYAHAADLGHPEAMYNLGLFYTSTRGGERNVPRGVSYLKKAANTGMAQAAYNLGVIYEGDVLGAADVQAALEWYNVAASSGNRDAVIAVRRLTRLQNQQVQARQLPDAAPAAGP